MSDTRPRWPRMTAIVGNAPKLIAQHSGLRAYYPHIVMHESDENTWEGKLTINEGGNQCRQSDEDGLAPFDRLALLFAAAPDLLALVERYASECAECDGTGVDPRPTGSGSTYACEQCADIRAAIAKATGR